MPWSKTLLSILLILSVAADRTQQNFNTPSSDLQVGSNNADQKQAQRPKRDYIQWYGGSTTFQQPYLPPYQIQTHVPYFVPIWGNPRRIPVFFPARPILFNPGYPVRNPPGAGVRPTTTTEKPLTEDGVEINIGNRINVNAEGEPIWGVVESEETVGGSRVPGSPARTPSRPRTPPLLHRPSLSDKDGQASAPGSVQRPPAQFRPASTTVRPVQGRQEPNRCVWAIISCCNPTNNQISYNCFERLGCPGAFWDNNPCNKDIVSSALNAAAKFYEQT